MRDLNLSMYLIVQFDIRKSCMVYCVTLKFNFFWVQIYMCHQGSNVIRNEPYLFIIFRMVHVNPYV